MSILIIFFGLPFIFYTFEYSDKNFDPAVPSTTKKIQVSRYKITTDSDFENTVAGSSRFLAKEEKDTSNRQPFQSDTSGIPIAENQINSDTEDQPRPQKTEDKTNNKHTTDKEKSPTTSLDTPRKTLPLIPEEVKKKTTDEKSGQVNTDGTKPFFIRVHTGNIRKRPSVKARVVFQLNKGAAVTVTEKRGKWYAVRLKDGRSGWGYRDLFTEKPPAGHKAARQEIASKKNNAPVPEKDKIESTFQQPLQIKAKKRDIRYLKVKTGNIRKRPTINSKVLFFIQQGDAVTVTKKKGRWYAVKLQDGRSGWGHRNLFTKSFPRKDLRKNQPAEKSNIIKTIRPILSSDDIKRIIFELNGYFIPKTSVIEGERPRIVCEFLNTRMADSISPVINLNDDIIKKIRIGIHENPRRIRVVLDLIPDRNYTIEQVFFRKENYYSLAVKPRT